MGTKVGIVREERDGDLGILRRPVLGGASARTGEEIARRRRATAIRDARVSAWGARRCELPGRGNAAACGSPERRRRRADAAESSAHGGVDSGDGAAFRQPICGEEVEGATAELPACSDSCGEEQGGRAARRRRRRLRRRARERKGEGEYAGGFAEKSVTLS